jgi:tetratricopeptide (TPR) repeat protein
MHFRFGPGIFALIVLLHATIAFATYERAERNWGQSNINYAGHRKTIIDLTSDGFYFASVPWLKDLLVKNSKRLDPEIESSLEEILDVTGIKAFENLPVELLAKSRTPSIRYIVAKKLFLKEKYNEALDELSGAAYGARSFPFISHLKGAIYSSLGKFDQALGYFQECAKYSQQNIYNLKSRLEKKQLAINRDFCIAGIARSLYSKRDFSASDLSYLDIDKESFIWPEILIEEAWNSYYQKNYNRTLGKLVSYKAPVFDFIFKPEAEVLKALTFLKMCLYEDAKKTVDEFYSDLLVPSRNLRTFLLRHGKDHRFYYSLLSGQESFQESSTDLVPRILKSISREAAFIEMKSSLHMALAELNRIRKKRGSSFRSSLERNIKLVIEEYQAAMGSYIRAGLVSKYAELYSSFQGMSYIKLEVLAQKKEKLYQAVPETNKRGDLKYLPRNDRQYFWNFNGEFWADELGDYVFALGSEC